MRRFLILSILTGALLLYLVGSVLQALRLEGRGPLNVSSADLLDSGTVARLGLQLQPVGGKVVLVMSNMVQVRDKHGHIYPITFAPKAQFLEGTTKVPETAIELDGHVSAEALHAGSGYVAFNKVHVSPHHHAIGGVIAAMNGGLTIVNRHNGASFVHLTPGAAITIRGQPFRSPLSLHLAVVAEAFPDPLVQGIFVASTVHVLASQVSRRVGGIVTSINVARGRIALYSKSARATYTIELLPTTKTTLGPFSATLADMRVGDHVTVTGKPDLVNTGAGVNPLLAKIIRISSPAFGGVIASMAFAPHGSVVLTLRGRHGHVLRIDAPGQAQVYTITSGIQQNAHVLDLFVGEHISVRGTRVGKFEERAISIHVYPHQHTIGGTVASVLPGAVRIVTTAGKQYIVRVTARTSYTLNGKLSTIATVRPRMHIRVRGYDALHNDLRSIPSIIAAHISVIVHTPKVHTAKKKPTPARATATPTPKALRVPPTTGSISTIGITASLVVPSSLSSNAHAA
jgi:hypothetical protein